MVTSTVTIPVIAVASTNGLRRRIGRSRMVPSCLRVVVDAPAATLGRGRETNHGGGGQVGGRLPSPRAGGQPLDDAPVDGGQPPGQTEEASLEAPRTNELDDLLREIVDLRASRERLALADDDERRRLERALHEGLQQQLVGLAANLELAAASVDADPTATTSLLAAMRRDLQEAIEDTRTLAHRIYPPLLEAGGLAPALREAAARADVKVAIEIAAGTALSPEVAAAIYFSGADTLERAGAGASATISVRADEATVSFEIDVDRDLDTGSPPTSRDRVEALGGSLDIDRTRLVGSLPRSR